MYHNLKYHVISNVLACKGYRVYFFQMAGLVIRVHLTPTHSVGKWLNTNLTSIIFFVVTSMLYSKWYQLLTSYLVILLVKNLWQRGLLYWFSMKLPLYLFLILNYYVVFMFHPVNDVFQPSYKGTFSTHASGK